MTPRTARATTVISFAAALAVSLLLAGCSTGTSSPGGSTNPAVSTSTKSAPPVVGWGQAGALPDGVTVTVQVPVRAAKQTSAAGTPNEPGHHYYSAKVTLVNHSKVELHLSYEGRAGGKEAPWYASEDATDALPGETLTTAATFAVPDGSAELVVTTLVTGNYAAGGTDRVTSHGPIG